MYILIDSAVVEVRQLISVLYNAVLLESGIPVSLIIAHQIMLLAFKTNLKYPPLSSNECIKSLELYTIRVFYGFSY